MAHLLDRLGRFSARRAWAVIAGWIITLALAAGAFLAFGGTLATSFSIPGTETSRVSDEISEQLGETAGATGTVVFQADSGDLTDTQRSEISTLLDDIAELDGVNSVIDPFVTEQQRAEQAQQLADGRSQIEAARAQLEASAEQLDAGAQQLDAAQQQLDAAREQAAAAGPVALQQIEAQQQQLDAQREQLEQGRAELEQGRAELETQAEQLEAGERLLAAAAEISTVSDDGTTALGSVVFDYDTFSLPAEVKASVAEALDAASISGVSVDYSTEIAASVEGLLGPGEVIGVVVAALVLLVMLRALLPAVLPLISSVVGVGTGVAGAMAFSGLVEMSSVTPVLGVMLGLAVGIDYSLFIINRHRRQLRSGMPVRESIGLANGTAGNAVVFAGSTVLVALLALNVTGISFLGVMGTVGAVCVLIAVLISISFTPALLSLLGTRVLNRRARREITAASEPETTPKPMRTSAALASSVLGVVALLVIAIPALSMRLGLPDGSAEAQDTTQYRAFTTVAEKFGAGQNGPLVVTASLPEQVNEDALTSVQADLADRLLEEENVVAVAPAATSDERDFILFQVVPEDGPASVSTEQLVHDLRGLGSVSVGSVDGEIALGVAGQASGNVDISAILASALPLYLAVVVGLSLIIMIVVFRSLLVPLLATGGYVLSLLAAFGATVAVYQWGWLGALFGVHETGPVLNFAPIIVMGVLFGLAMDYQLFLVSGMREAYVHGMPARSAVIAGRRNGRAVVTAAAIIMVSVFGGFVFSHMAMVRPIGFGLAIGVLFDAFVVRMLIVPALMHLLGSSVWWLPRWLDRVIPNVDVEGAALEREHARA